MAKMRKIPTWLTTEEIYRLRNQTKTMHDQMIVDCLFYFGLRVSELCALKPQWFNFKEGMLELPAECCKKNKSRRIPIPQCMVKYLKNYIKSMKPDENMIKVGRRQVNVKLHQWKNEAKIEKRVHAHVLRHSYASLIYQTKHDLGLVKDLLGHESIQVTQIYAHSDDKHKITGIEGVFS